MRLPFVPPALFFFLASATCFPKDLIPLSTVGVTGTAQYPYFRGLAGDNDTAQLGLDFQSMQLLNRTLFIAARDHVYAFDLRRTKDDFSPIRHLTWRTQDMGKCAMRGKLQSECYNYIKVLVPKNDQTLLACGTNAFNPVCRTYKISSLEQEGEELNGQARCPFDAKQPNVALFAEGNLYSATVADFLASDAVIYRSLGERSPVLRTVRYDSKWLREPHFLHALEYRDFVYFFFREISMEYTALGRVIFSPVGGVGKNDRGGSPRVLEKYWTSFLKARLNCSVPGDSFFYFDVLQAVTDVSRENGPAGLFSIFSPPTHSIMGSAVCAFYMDEVERVFDGKFKEQKNADAAWTPIPEEKVPKPRPGCCAGIGRASAFKTSNDFPDEMLSFIKSFPLLDEAVPSIAEQPWFTKTASRYKLTHLAADPAAGPFRNYTVLFLGSEDGTVLKMLSRMSENATVETLLLEEVSVYHPSQCSIRKADRRVLGFTLDAANHALYVAFSSCVVRVPLSRCGAHSTCRRSCLASRDPYCVWLHTGACVAFNNEIRSGFEQDVENAARYTGSCQDVVTATGNRDGSSNSAYAILDRPFQKSPQAPLYWGAVAESLRPSAMQTRCWAARVAVATGLPQLPFRPKVAAGQGWMGKMQTVAASTSGPFPEVPQGSHPASLAPDARPAPGVGDPRSTLRVAVSTQGVRQEAEGRDGARTVHFTFLIGCVFVAFLLGAFLSGLLVSCYCSHAGQKGKHGGRDLESGLQRPLSLRSLARMNGLAENPAKDGLVEAASTKLYTTLLPSEKEPPSAAALAKAGAKEHPELSGLPTPESTPELPLKNMKAIRNQWERNQNFNNAKEAQGKPPLFHTPGAASHAYPLPSAVAVHGYDAPLVGYLDEKKIPNSERVLVRHSQCYLPKGVEVTTLEELLRHLHETHGPPRKAPGSAPAHLPPAAAAVSFANRVQPKIPDVESAPYYSSSTLPRDSLPRRLDVPPDPPPPQACLEKPGRPAAHRHSLCAAPKLANVAGGAGLARQHSLGPAGRPPPAALLTRMHSTGSSVPEEGRPAAFLARQHSYGEPAPLPSHGGIKRSVSLVKPSAPAQPLFMPSSPPARASGQFHY
ncbi:semaphorin-6C [Varanus komodoensis]|uniref:semaphorin-6C n=1 Tax=Varanus komodoensis TaxID=61221 RepID=UPI001CF79C63|nr:semaphorin-6C [Varanus komodoensis]